MSSLEGILAVYKPAGFTSHDVVAKARGILQMKRIGHTGTLDPQVTGVLPLCLGRATRMVEYLQELPKEYHATVRLGMSSDTEDATGQVIEQVDAVDVTREQIEEVIASFVGVIQQVPPMYSALKVNGKRLYELAREGKSVERKSREVTIHEIEITSCELDQPHPEISFRVLCSKGTYIRTLCVDIGRKLMVPSLMVKLERTISSGITADKCLTFEQMEAYMKDGTLAAHLIPVDEAVQHLPAHTVIDEKRAAALQGQRLSHSVVHPPVVTEESIRLYDSEGIFLGIFMKQEGTGAIAPVKVFLQN